MLDKETVVNIVKQYVEAVTKEFEPSAVVLFGSYINGNPNEDSDIDVGVVFNGFTGDWLQTAAQLWRLRRKVSLDIEPHLLDSTNDQSGFVNHIFKTGQVIYQV
ncbi:MAG: nucleotidyltransferase domain-containing protein [Oscillospiraceae bacterium]|nr:nucleotidyltransferase domain-containing protein [Oscillospiraceae bacterium]